VLHSPVHIMANPHRGRGGSVNGRGGGTLAPKRDSEPPSNYRASGIQESNEDALNYRGRGTSHGLSPRGSDGRGGNLHVLGGRGGFTGGRGINLPPRGGGGFRSRGRGQGALWSAS